MLLSGDDTRMYSAVSCIYFILVYTLASLYFEVSLFKNVTAYVLHKINNNGKDAVPAYCSYVEGLTVVISKVFKESNNSD
jgi:hypothetical protein